MDDPDPFTAYYADDLDGYYDSVDRLVFNAYFARGQQGGGFRHWWRQLFGDEENLTNEQLRKMAGDFSRRVQAYSKKHDIPLIRCQKGKRKSELASELLAETPKARGIFAIFIAKAPALLWDVQITAKGFRHLERKKPWPMVNHYHFHIFDPEWGHFTIKMSGYPPFGCQIMLNGHEWVERHLRKQTISLEYVSKEGNCFVGGARGIGEVHALAEQLLSPTINQQLKSPIDRWIYSSCLAFGLSLDDQKQSGFRYEYSTYQLEYSRNLIFKEAERVDEVLQWLIDRTRKGLGVEKIRTIFGYKQRGWRKVKGKRVPVRIERLVDESQHDMTVFKLHYGRMTLKIYDKGERVLRIEAMVHNVKELRCGKIIEKLPDMLGQLQRMVTGFLEVIQAADRTYLGPDEAQALQEPTQRGRNRLAGVDLYNPRQQAAAQSLTELAAAPQGFTVRELTEKVTESYGGPYDVRRAGYDLRKMRGKGLVEKQGKSRRYRVTTDGVRKLIGLHILGKKVIQPVLAGITHHETPCDAPPNIHPIDETYRRLHQDMNHLFSLFGLVA